MKKFLISFVLFLLALIMGIVYIQQNGYRLIKTKDGISVGKSLSNLDNLYLNNYFVVLTEENNRQVYSYAELGITCDIPNYSIDWIIEDRTDMSPVFVLDKMPEQFENLNNGRHSSSTGHLVFEDDVLTIKDAQKSNMLDIDQIYNAVRLLINSDEEQVTVDLTKYYVEDNDNNALDGMQSQIDLYNNFKISYTNGYELTLERLRRNNKVFIEDNKLVCDVDVDYLKEVAAARLYTYNTVDTDFVFTTHDNREKTVHSNTYGDYVSYAEEANYLYSVLDNLSPSTEPILDRTPIMKQEAKFDISQTYIEVSIAEQHIWYYKDGELQLDTDVVTGKPTQDRSTHTGIFEVYNKSKDAHLEKWNVDVERWMSITYDGQGFHDASWRKAFGGTIYKSNGSHGCINTPKAKMFELYDMVEIGTPVVIY